MKISLNWLKQYVELPKISPEDIASRLTMTTAEVECVQCVRRNTREIFVCKVLSAKPIKSGNSLKLVDVELGHEVHQTVCGAPNVTPGMLSLFGKPGALILDGCRIEEKEVSGYISQGVLCSPRDLGLGELDAEIISFSGNLESGTPFSECCENVDHVIEIDNKSITNRPDLWGHYGFARELTAIFACELKPCKVADLSDYLSLPVPNVSIEDVEGCPRYSCIVIENVEVAASPLHVQIPLLTIGMRPINLPVDLTNYIMLELGQPMHAFDGSIIKSIRVAPLGREGLFTTLDGFERSLSSEDLMIFDGDKPIAIAGVMGGADSEVTDETNVILLESANFDAFRIRRTSTRMGLRTDASIRFEKNQPLGNTKIAIHRFVNLLLEAQPTVRIASSLFDEVTKQQLEEHKIILPKDYVSKTIGKEIHPEEAVRILERLQFTVKDGGAYLEVYVPEHRSRRDISIPEDIVEEVARIYGYDNIEPTMPKVVLSDYGVSQKRKLEREIRLLLSQTWKMSEVHTYGWFDNKWLKRIDFTSNDALRLKNPSSEDNDQMRTTLLLNLLQLVGKNAVYFETFGLYELGQVFLPLNHGTGLSERTFVAGIVCSRKGHFSPQELFSRAKGIVESLCVLQTNKTEKVKFTNYRDMQLSNLPWFRSSASQSVQIDGKYIGSFGLPDYELAKKLKRGILFSTFEIDVDALIGVEPNRVAFSEPDKLPGSWLDFSIVYDANRPFSELIDILDGFSHWGLKYREFVCVYQGKELPRGKKSYTFRYHLGLKERTVTGEDIEDFKKSMLSFLQKRSLDLRGIP